MTDQPDAPYVSRCPDRRRSELLGAFTQPLSLAKLEHLKRELDMNCRRLSSTHEYVMASIVLRYDPEEWGSIVLRAVRAWEREHPGLEVELFWTNEKPTSDFIEAYRQKVQQTIASLPAD